MSMDQSGVFLVSVHRRDSYMLACVSGYSRYKNEDGGVLCFSVLG